MALRNSAVLSHSPDKSVTSPQQFGEHPIKRERERERERETLLGNNVHTGGSWARSGDRQLTDVASPKISSRDRKREREKERKGES